MKVKTKFFGQIKKALFPVNQGYLHKAGFEKKIASNTEKVWEAYIAPNIARLGFIGYVGT